MQKMGNFFFLLIVKSRFTSPTRLHQVTCLLKKLVGESIQTRRWNLLHHAALKRSRAPRTSETAINTSLSHIQKNVRSPAEITLLIPALYTDSMYLAGKPADTAPHVCRRYQRGSVSKKLSAISNRQSVGSSPRSFMCNISHTRSSFTTSIIFPCSRIAP